MTGRELKVKLSECGVSQSEIARRLEMSQQSFNQALVVNDVKSGLLERIAQALGLSMSFFYPTDGNNAVASGNKSVAAINSNVSSPTAAVLEERVRALETLVAEKERLIKVLMEGRK